MPKRCFCSDGRRFSGFATPIAFCAIKPCTAHDMNQVIDPIIQKYGGHHSEKLFYHIDAITVNNQPADYYIGQTGDIRCMMHIIALQRDDWTCYAKSIFGRDIDQISIYPSSFFTLHHIKESLHKTSGTLISIGQYHTKRIVFSQGMYKTCEMLDLGWQVLKDIYAENNIRDFFDASKAAIEEEVVQRTCRALSTLLCRYASTPTPLVQHIWRCFVSDIVHNEFFMDMFSHS